MIETSLLVRRGLKLTQLRLIVALADQGQVGLAASRLGITQPAASRLLSELERITGEPMHERSGRGITLTEQGRALAKRARRVLIEIDEAGRDVAESGAGLRGHVRIGSVTGPALDYVLPAIRSARLSVPDVTVEVDIAPSDQLADKLLAGRLDLSLSRIPDSRDRSDFQITRLGGEKVVFLVRQGHPLTGRDIHSGLDLLNYDWVMPAKGAILRQTVERRMETLGLPLPRVRVETTSFLLTLALVQQTNAIAPLALAVARQFGGDGQGGFAILGPDLGIEVEPFGLITNAGASLSPATERLRQLILDEAAKASE